jgi:hypothetical protein
MMILPAMLFSEISPPSQAGFNAGKRHSGITEIAGTHTPPCAEAQARYAVFKMHCFNMFLVSRNPSSII